MSPKIHISCGMVSGAIAYAITKLVPFSLSCGFANFLFDVDHCLEYTMFCIKNKKLPSLYEFFSGAYFQGKDTICVIFHGYEYILLFFLMTTLSFAVDSSIRWIWLGIMIGYTEHMILDLIGNDCSIKGYSLVYRIFVRFNLNKICTKHKKLI